MRLGARQTALAVISPGGNPDYYDELLFSAKPHPGCSRWRRGCGRPRGSSTGRQLGRPHLQDRYSLRCGPHVLGVLADALPRTERQIETEINSANDNPLIDCPGERIMLGGVFYGGHVAFVMDSLKTAVANIADLLDRQFALLMDAHANGGLPRICRALRRSGRRLTMASKPCRSGVRPGRPKR